MWNIGKLCITVGFGTCNFRDVDGELRAATRNVGGRWVFPLAPAEREYTKSEEYFAKMENCNLDGLSVVSDFEVISDIKKGSATKQDSRKIELIVLNIP